MEKLHHFMYAIKFVLETDQKLLGTILAKSLNTATPQLQRILIKTFAYDFTVDMSVGTVYLVYLVYIAMVFP